MITNLFSEFDLDSDGAVTKEEIQSVIDSCPQLPIEGELYLLKVKLILTHAGLHR